MTRRLTLVSLGLAVVFALGYAFLNAGTEAAPAAVSVEMTSGRNLNNIAYNITVKNPTSSPLGNIFVSGLVPSGTRYVANSATAGGSLQGDQVVWVVNQVPAKGQAVLTYKVQATDPKVGTNHAWVHWLSPSEQVAMSSEVAADFQLIKIKGIGTVLSAGVLKGAYTEKHPGGKLAISTTSGKGHQEDGIITSGLDNVGAGEYVYLQGAEEDNLENEITSWTWRLIGKPVGSSASLEGTDKEVARFLADRVGEYLIEVSTTNSKGQSSSSTATVTAGKYAGWSLCVSCHDGSVPSAPNVTATFFQTGHSRKFEKQWDSYTKDNDYCSRCHTLGYNEQADNGGMDEAARASGWDPKLGSVIGWLKTNGWSIDQVKADPNMGRAINIQCENCHGPGATAHTGTKSFDPAVCGQCHVQPMQWQYAGGHTKVNPEMAANPSCARCHTGQGYVAEWVRGQQIVFPDAATPEKPANVPSVEQQSGISCAACHDPHAFTDSHQGNYGLNSNQLRILGEVTAPNGWKVDAGLAATCVRCHANNRTQAVLAQFIAGDYPRATHGNTQSDVFYGKGFYDYGGQIVTSNSFHTTLEEACITCHMAPNPVAGPGPDGQMGTRDDEAVASVGGHSWNMKGEWQGKMWENTAACAKCHAGATTFNRQAAGDYDGNGKVEGVQDEVRGLLVLLAAGLPKNPATGALVSPISNANSTEAQRKAWWNFALVNNDGSAGIHNTTFTVQLLQKTYKELTGKDVPGATLR